MGKKHAIDINWHNRHTESIAQGCLTNSKHPDRFIKGVYPNMIVEGKGCHLRSSKGEEYIDYICGLGTCLLGYQRREVVNACVNELNKGYSYSLPSTLEVEAAERLKGIIPFMERIKFLKTGSEAAMAAIRIARAYTGRKFVLSRGYHGWTDEFTSLTPPATGVAENIYMKKLVEIEQINDQIAAVIVEPVELDNSRERIIWLNQLKEKCHAHGVVLIFDEIITGFRYKNWCVSNYHNIRPDIILLGKSIANGLPLAVVGGRRDIMDNDRYFVSSTFAGENIALASMIKVIDLIFFGDLKINKLWDEGQTFIDRFNSFWPDKIYLDGYSVRAVFRGDEHVKAVFWQQSVMMNLLFGPSWFYMFPHIEHQYRVLDNISDLLTLMKSKMPVLRGQMPTSPFSDKQRK
jgi:glutamate-1-semialdehyde aminotransferase